MHSCPGEKKIWTKLGRRGNLTGTACFHRAAQAELLLFHEEILKGRKKLAPLLPSVNLSCALFLCLSLPSPLQQWEGGSMARQHLPTAGRPLIHRRETQRGTCPNLLEGQKDGATAQCQQQKSLQSNRFAGGGWERINCFS